MNSEGVFFKEPKVRIRVYPARGKSDHTAFVFPHPHRPNTAMVIWFYKGVEKVSKWWIPIDYLRSINRLRGRLKHKTWNPTICITNRPDWRK